MLVARMGSAFPRWKERDLEESWLVYGTGLIFVLFGSLGMAVGSLVLAFESSALRSFLESFGCLGLEVV